jgi:uncharacterized OB-fold protein
MTDQALHSKAFDQAIAEDLLIGSHCLVCGNISIPQRQICSNCHSDQVERVQMDGKGTLAAFTVIMCPRRVWRKPATTPKTPIVSG